MPRQSGTPFLFPSKTFSHFLSLNKNPFHFSLTDDGFAFKHSDKINWIIYRFFLLVEDQKSLWLDILKLLSALCLHSEFYEVLKVLCCLKVYFNGMLKFPFSCLTKRCENEIFWWNYKELTQSKYFYLLYKKCRLTIFLKKYTFILCNKWVRRKAEVSFYETFQAQSSTSEWGKMPLKITDLHSFVKSLNRAWYFHR